MTRMMTTERLRKENLAYEGTGGTSAGNNSAGFVPAFCDTTTGRVVPSRLEDGSPAPLHLLGGLPEEWVVARGDNDQVLAVKDTVIAGFLRDGAFYDRTQAADAVALL